MTKCFTHKHQRNIETILRLSTDIQKAHKAELIQSMWVSVHWVDWIMSEQKSHSPFVWGRHTFACSGCSQKVGSTTTCLPV